MSQANHLTKCQETSSGSHQLNSKVKESPIQHGITGPDLLFVARDFNRILSETKLDRVHPCTPCYYNALDAFQNGTHPKWKLRLLPPNQRTIRESIHNIERVNPKKRKHHINRGCQSKILKE